MRVFRGADAQPIDDALMPLVGIDTGVRTAFARMAELGVGAGVGDETVMLFRGPSEDSPSLTRVWFKSGYILPRHSHDADCLYFILSVELRMGSQVLQHGDGVFIPANTAYTYEAGSEGVEVLEFRNSASFHFRFERNSAADWDRVLTAFETRRERWAEEVAPSLRVHSSNAVGSE